MRDFAGDHRESGQYEAERISIGANILAMGLIASGGASMRPLDNTIIIDSFIRDWFFPEKINQNHPIDSDCAEKAFVNPIPALFEVKSPLVS